MTKKEARAWLEGWRRVNEFVIQEARSASAEERLRGLDLLFRSRSMFRWPSEEEAGVPEVRRRWLRLKKLNRG